MRERPILFNGSMVRAILAGQKTQTRRAVKVPPAFDFIGGAGDDQNDPKNFGAEDENGLWWALAAGPSTDRVLACPFGQPGDRLWVRETWMDLTGTGIEHRDTATGKRMRYSYGAQSPAGSASDEARKDFGLKWRPSIHMPRKACRLVLEITAVRVERLQAISDDDCAAEGVQRDRISGFNLERGTFWGPRPVDSFESIWDSTGGDWDSNPWVWVIDFKRVEVTNG